MTPLHLALDLFAPIPVGHHVTVYSLEARVMGGFVSSRLVIVCDDDTRIVYTTRGIGSETMTYEALRFDHDAPVRFAPTAPLRGRVVSCVVRSDSGDTVHMQTILGIEPDPIGYR